MKLFLQVSLATALFWVTTPLLPAQSFGLEGILQRGSPLSGGAQVSTSLAQPIPFAQVESDGDVFAFVHTESGKDVLWFNDQVILQEQGAFPDSGFPGSVIAEIHHAYLTESGSLATILSMNDGNGSPLRQSVVLNDQLLELEGGNANYSGLSGAVWESFRFVHLTADGLTLSLLGTVSFPNDPGVTADLRGLIHLSSSGSILSKEAIAFSSSIQPFPVGSAAITDLRREWFQFQPSEGGRQLFVGDFENPTTPYADNALWHHSGDVAAGTMYITGSLFAEPVTGDTVKWVVDTGFSISDSFLSSYVLRLAPTNGNPERDMLIRRGQPYVTGSSPVLALPGMQRTSFKESPCSTTTLGEVFWIGTYGTGPGEKRVLFKDSAPLIVEGFTQLGQETIDSMDPWGGAFDISPDGDWMVFTGEVDGLPTLMRYRIGGEYESFCFGNGGTGAGCTSCPCSNNATQPGGGCLNSSGQSAQLTTRGRAGLSGDSLRFLVSGANANTFGILVSANNRLPNVGPCPPGSGVTSPVIDGLRCVGGGLLRHGTRMTNSSGEIGTGNSGWGPQSSASSGLVQQHGFSSGQTRHFQCFYRDGVDVGCMRGQNTTNAVSVQITP